MQFEMKKTVLTDFNCFGTNRSTYKYGRQFLIKIVPTSVCSMYWQNKNPKNCKYSKHKVKIILNNLIYKL